MSAAALLMSVGFAGGPVIARAIVPNADKVDGLDAVKSTATTKQRKGKLVATDKKTGQLNANVVPNAAKFPAKVPTGVTLRGAFSFESQYSGHAGDYGSSIDFGAQLPHAPTTVVVKPGDPTTDLCPGSDQSPQAAAGILCLYVTQSSGMDLDSLASDIWPFGVHWHFNNDNTVSAGDDFYVRGVYAVTAGNPLELKNRSDHK